MPLVTVILNIFQLLFVWGLFFCLLVCLSFEVHPITYLLFGGFILHYPGVFFESIQNGATEDHVFRGSHLKHNPYYKVKTLNI